MLATLALSLAVVVGGAIATYLYDPDAPALTRLFTGAATGYAAVALVAFLVAWVAGVGPIAVGAGFAVALLPLALLRQRHIREAVGGDLRAARAAIATYARRPTPAASAELLFWALVAVGLWLIFDRVVLELPDGLYTGFVNNFGDLPLHLQITASFAYGNNIPPENPIFMGAAYSYPYMTDVLSALFVAGGASFRDAFLIPNFVLAVSLVGVLWRWTRDLTGDRLAAAIAPLLLIFSGGLGWLQVLEAARSGERGLLAAIGGLDHDVTIQGDSIFRFGNAIIALLVPQRSLLLGLPIAIVVFTLLWAELREARGPRFARSTKVPRPLRFRQVISGERRMVAAGLLTGMLPLVHAHTFVAVLGTAFFLGLVFRQWRDGQWVRWAAFVAAAAVVAVPEIAWSTAGSATNAAGFIGIQLGWDRGENNPILFWIANTGLFIPLLVLAFLLDRDVEQNAGDAATGGSPEAASEDVDSSGDEGLDEGEPIVPPRVMLYYLPFALWFIIPNVFRLAPWIWDNIKILLIWYVASVPFVAVVIAVLLRGDRLRRLAGVAVLVSLTLAGALDIGRVVLGRTEYRVFDGDAVAFAATIRSAVPPRGVVLHAPTYNPPVYLTGRRSLMGYPGHLWSSGIDFADRERDVRAIYAGEPGADELLRRYGIGWIEVGPLERTLLTVNDEYIDHFRLVAEQGEYRLYAVPGS